jgi:hypothetical protein
MLVSSTGGLDTDPASCPHDYSRETNHSIKVISLLCGTPSLGGPGRCSSSVGFGPQSPTYLASVFSKKSANSHFGLEEGSERISMDEKRFSRLVRIRSLPKEAMVLISFFFLYLNSI